MYSFRGIRARYRDDMVNPGPEGLAIQVQQQRRNKGDDVSI